MIPYAADRNPDKWGSETIATHIPIISEEQSREMNPNYYLAATVALPRRSFLIASRSSLGGGGRFIVPLPEVRIVPAE